MASTLDGVFESWVTRIVWARRGARLLAPPRSTLPTRLDATTRFADGGRNAQ